LIEGTPRFVLALDNTYLYRNMETQIASETFSPADHAANIKNQERMIRLDRPRHSWTRFSSRNTRSTAAWQT
jgi:hypothetical protein